VIDVSQAVEHDHPHALEFLRKDVTNVIEYFRKKLTCHIMTVRELFDFVIADLDTIKKELDKSIDFDNLSEKDILNLYLDKMDIIVQKRPAGYLDEALVQSEEQVFKNVYIPRTLEEIPANEMDSRGLEKGDKMDVS
jgi:RIO kinase 1